MCSCASGVVAVAVAVAVAVNVALAAAAAAPPAAAAAASCSTRSLHNPGVDRGPRHPRLQTLDVSDVFTLESTAGCLHGSNGGLNGHGKACSERVGFPVRQCPETTVRSSAAVRLSSSLRERREMLRTSMFRAGLRNPV